MASEAVPWDRLGWWPHAAQDAMTVGLDVAEARRWEHAGVPSSAVAETYTAANGELSRVESLLMLGLDLSDETLVHILEAGLTSDEVDEWRRAGIEMDFVGRLAQLGLTATEARDWFEARFPFATITDAHKGGGTLADALAYRRAGFGAGSDNYFIGRLLGLGMKAEEAERFRELGFDLRGTFNLKQVGLDREAAAAWSRTGMSADLVVAFKTAGVDTPETALRWWDAGLSPHGLEAFHRCGIEPSEARRWQARGFRGQDAVSALGAGKIFESAVPPLAHVRWSQVFSRSSLHARAFAVRHHAEGDHLDRFFSVCDDLAIPHASHVELFGSRREAWPCLDGGAFRLDGQTWVIGYKALRFLCARMGLIQPRQLNGEDEVASPELLEREFANQIHWGWPILETMLGALLSVYDGHGLTAFAEQRPKSVAPALSDDD